MILYVQVDIRVCMKEKFCLISEEARLQQQKRASSRHKGKLALPPSAAGVINIEKSPFKNRYCEVGAGGPSGILSTETFPTIFI